MSGVFQNIDHPTPLSAPPLLQGENTLAGWRRGWGVNILQDARHSSVLYLCRILLGGGGGVGRGKQRVVDTE
jgi:hypothetical protein